MTVKKTYGFTKAQADWITTKTGEMGFSIRDLIEMLINDITGDKEPDDPERADMAKKWFERLSAKYYEETFLTYLLSLSDGEMREFIDCLLFLKQMKDRIKKIDGILHLLKEDPIEDLDEDNMSELQQICSRYGIEVDEKNKDKILLCLEEEKRDIQADMYVADLGFEPGNLFSAVDVVVKAFDAYCRTYEVENADIIEELKKVIKWLEESENRFQQVN